MYFFAITLLTYKTWTVFYNRNRFLCCYFVLCLVERVSFRWFFAWLASNVIRNVRKQDLCQNKKNFYEEHAWKNADFFSSLPFASTAFIDLRKCHNVDEKSSEVVLLSLKFRFSEKATKIWKKSSSLFWHLLSKHQNHEEDWTNFCGLLRKSEL